MLPPLPGTRSFNPSMLQIIHHRRHAVCRRFREQRRKRVDDLKGFRTAAMLYLNKHSYCQQKYYAKLQPGEGGG